MSVYTINVPQGVSAMQLHNYIKTAKGRLSKGENVDIVFPAGKFNFDVPDFGQSALHVVNAGGQGMLRFKGQGKDATLIAVQGPGGAVAVRRSNGVTFQDMGFFLGSEKGSTTQGRVTKIEDRSVEVQLEEGYPTPAEINDNHLTEPKTGGQFLKRYVYNGDACEVDVKLDKIKGSRRGTAYTAYQPVDGDSGRTWKFNTPGGISSGTLAVGDLAVFNNDYYGARPYVITNSSDVVFQNVRWYQRARGTIRNDVKRISFLGCSVEPMANRFPKPQCLTDTDGGIYVGHPSSTAEPIEGVVIKDFVAKNTGLSGITLFGARDAVIENVTISDSWGHGIRLFNSTVKESSVTLIRNNQFKTASPEAGANFQDEAGSLLETTTAGLLTAVTALRKMFH